MGKRTKPQKLGSSNRLKVSDKGGKPTNELQPVFALSYLHDGPYGLNACDQEHKSAFVDTLRKLSQLTWAQIQNADRHGCGHEKIPRESINAQIPRSITEDVTLLVFRYYGRNPMVGYRDGEVLYILWIDHDFSLYDHGS